MIGHNTSAGLDLGVVGPGITTPILIMIIKLEALR